MAESAATSKRGPLQAEVPLQAWEPLLAVLLQAMKPLHIHGHSQLRGEVRNFPPTWQISSQQWLISRDDPMCKSGSSSYPRVDYASHDSVDHTPDWSTGWETVTDTSGNQGYAYARDGNQHTLVASDGTIHVWRDNSAPSNRWGKARSKSPTSTWEQQA